MKTRRVLIGLVAFDLFLLTANAQQPVSVAIYEYTVDSGLFIGGAHAIAAGSDGALWFAENRSYHGSYYGIWRITTAGVATDLGSQGCCGTLSGITAGPDGALWYTFGVLIGRVTTSGAFTTYSPPTEAAGITAGPDGALWFTEYNNNTSGTVTQSAIGRITTSGAITQYPLPTASAAPQGIAAGPDGALWFTESGKIGRITTSGTSITEYPVPTPGTLTGIAAGPDGALWFAESGSGQIGRITLAGVVTEYPVPTGAPVQSISAGPDGAMWFTAGAYIGRITMAGAITEYPVPTEGFAAGGITAGPDGAMWFTADGFVPGSGGPEAALVVGQIVINPNLPPPVLSIAKNHAGNFIQGQSSATYTLTVSNQQAAGPTSGFVTVTDTLPSGLSLVSMAGSFWNCTGNSCRRSDPLPGGATYPPIAVTVNVAPQATSPEVNQAMVTGGGSASASTSDSTTIISQPPLLGIAKTHNGSFGLGQTNAAYTITVSNQSGTGPTVGAVTVTDTLPSGLTLVSMTGAGWNCTGNSCTRSDALIGGASYPPITATVSVAANASSPQVNLASVSGGGNASTVGIADSTTVIALPVLNVVKGHAGNFTQGQNGATYTVVVSNQAGAGPNNGTVWVTETVPSGLTLVSMSGSGWACGVGATCSRSDPLAGGASYPAITVTVNVAANASSPQVNQVNMLGGGSPSVSATDSTIVNPAASHPEFFTGEAFLGNGVYYLPFPQSAPFGYYGYLSNQWIYHMDLGYEYILPAQGDPGNAIYMYDLASGHWFFASPLFFPCLYDFTLNAWIYYMPDTSNPGRYTTNPRQFAYTSTHVIFTM